MQTAGNPRRQEQEKQMDSRITGLSHLQLTVQRLIDADLLLDEEAAPLLAEIDGVLRSPEGPDSAAAGRLVRCVAPLAQRLASTFPGDSLAVVHAPPAWTAAAGNPQGNGSEP
jgi:hypothetical protein